jgi:hypothetical protein
MATGVKTGGRQKGTANKVTKDLRQLLKDVVVGELNNIDNLLPQVEPKDRLELLVKLLPYTLPRYEQVAFEDEQKSSGTNFFKTINSQALLNKLDGTYKNPQESFH